MRLIEWIPAGNRALALMLALVMLAGLSAGGGCFDNPSNLHHELTTFFCGATTTSAPTSTVTARTS
ncbi:hypothetical protein ACYZTL_00595 [Pseudomonas sp. LB3P81]